MRGSSQEVRQFVEDRIKKIMEADKEHKEQKALPKHPIQKKFFKFKVVKIEPSDKSLNDTMMQGMQHRALLRKRNSKFDTDTLGSPRNAASLSKRSSKHDTKEGLTSPRNAHLTKRSSKHDTKESLASPIENYESKPAARKMSQLDQITS